MSKNVRKYFALLFLAGQVLAQTDNGFIKIGALHQTDFIPNTDQVKYKYSYTNGLVVGIQFHQKDSLTKQNKSSFEIGAGYAQFVMNSKSYVVRADTYAINKQAPMQDFYFKYSRSFMLYLQYNQWFSRKLNWQAGYMLMHGALSNTNVSDKPFHPGVTYPPGGMPGYTQPPDGYYYSKAITIANFYGGIGWCAHKNLVVSLNVIASWNNQGGINNNNNLGRFPSDLFAETATIDHTLQRGWFLSGMVKLSYSFWQRSK
jgi:hypothetical protein